MPSLSIPREGEGWGGGGGGGGGQRVESKGKGGGHPLPLQLRDNHMGEGIWGSAVSSPIGVEAFASSTL